MDLARLSNAESIFNDLADQTPDRREALIAARCGGDADLRKLVERLLANDRSGMGRFLRKPAFQPSGNGTQETEGPASLPARIGSYEIVRLIGEGGMGVVYEARQANPRRRVAIKVLRSALPSRAMLERFRHEAQMLAHLRHPGLAHIYEAGVTEVTLAGGVRAEQPYFVMEFVEGAGLCEFASSRGLELRDRLELMARVCDAVQHAHEKGVIHRDLKPENVLVVEEGAGARMHEGTGEIGGAVCDRSFLRALPRILDFGVARLTNDDANAANCTRDGEIIGTPAYMSPEQIGGDAARVDTRSDVYSLGVMTYELLSGRPPHDLRDLPLMEVARRIREEPAPPLSTFARAFRGDVETIVAKAMHKDPSRRYESAAALAGDLRRFLAGEPIDARRDSAVYVLGKTLRRYRWGVAACCVFVAGLAAFAWHAGASAQENFRLAQREQQARKHAEAATMAAKEARDDEIAQRTLAVSEAEHAQSVTRFLVEMLDLADPDVTQRSELTVREVLERASAELDGAFEDRPEAEATLRTVIGRAYAGLGQPEPARRHLERALLLRERTLASGPAELYEVMWPLTHVLADLSDTLAHNRAARCARVGRQALAQTLPELADRCGELAGLMKYDYPAGKAESVRDDALRMTAASLTPEDDRWLLIADQLFFCGMFLAPRQNAGPACEYYQEALDIYRRSLPETNTRIVRALGQLLTAQIVAGRNHEAEAVAVRAVALVRETLPADHWYVALCNARLGGCLIGLGRLSEAEPLLEEGYASVVAARGAAGRYASEILRNLVRLDDAAGRPEQAAVRRDALAAAIAGSPEYASWVASDIWTTSARAAFGPRRDALAQSLTALNAALREGGPAAADAIDQTTRVWDALLPEGHPLSAVIAEIVISWLAYDAAASGPTDAVLDMTRRTVRVARASGSIHPRKRAYILAQAGIQFRERSQLDDAERVIRDALAILDDGYGNYAFTDWAEAHLGVVLAAQERFDEAETLLLSGYRGLLDYGGPTTADTRGALRHLLSLYERTGRMDRFAEVATDDIRNLLAASDVNPVDEYGAAWRIARTTGFPAESYELSLELARGAAGSLPDLDSSHRALGAALMRTGRYAEALNQLQEADKLAAGSRRGRLPRDLALLAMTQHHLGNRDGATAALAEARRLLVGSKRASDADRRLLEEAAALIEAPPR